MGAVTSLHRVSDEKLDGLIADPSGVRDNLTSVDRDGPTGYLDKSIGEIQALLTAAKVPVWIAPIEMPGEPIQFGGTGICFGLSSAKVAEIAGHLRATPFDALASRLAIDTDEDEADYLRGNYDNLVEFVEDATSRGLAAILTHG
jgi:hypothetical protein